MKSQPNRNYKSDDIVMTPIELAEKLVNHFMPQGKGLEPCKGTGNIYKYLKNADWCEITEGKDFFDYSNKVDYIFTNPPWSKIRDFLKHSMELSNEIYFLITINHLWTKARLRDIEQSGFGIKEICIFDTPKEFPQSGFQCGMVHLSKNYVGDIKFTNLKFEEDKELMSKEELLRELEDRGFDFDIRSLIINDIVEIIDQQTAELKAENERLKEESKNYCKDFIEVSQQLKEKDQELKQQEKHIVGQNVINNQLKNKLKTNTNQVCEKIKERVKKIEFNKTPEKMQQAIKFSVCYEIDQIEKGEDNG